MVKSADGVREATNGAERGYFLSAQLVNRLIMSIIGSLVVICGYMIVWAINDARWKASQETRLDGVSLSIGSIQQKIKPGILDVANERTTNINNRLDQIERKLEDHEH